MKKTLTLSFIMLCCISYAQNQQVVPSSPTASALGNYVDNPVSLYTGVPQISIPLYNLKVKDFTLPISLSYHAGGVKVGDAATSIGLGWALNAGGTIARVVKGLPDDHYYPQFCEDTYGPGDIRDCRVGYLYTDRDLTSIDLADAYRQDSIDNGYSWRNITRDLQFDDTEPDVFYFNLAGKTGKFVFEVVDGKQTIRIMSHHELRISHQFQTEEDTNRFDAFEIIDDKGIKYTFSDDEWMQIFMLPHNQSVCLDPTPGACVRLFFDKLQGIRTYYPVSWRLTQITTPLGEVIDFTYQEERYEMITEGGETSLVFHPAYSFDEYNYDPTYLGGRPLYDLYIPHFSAKRLTQIESSNTLIRFESDHLREDVWTAVSASGSTEKFARAITGLTVYSKSSLGPTRRIKKWGFEHDYFISPGYDTYRINNVEYNSRSPIPGQGNMPIECGQYSIGTTDRNLCEYWNANYKRLRLRTIQEYGITDSDQLPPTTFEYKDPDFDYPNNQRLPHRMSRKQDLWGYYNDAMVNYLSLIPRIYVYPDMFNDSRQFSVYRRLNHTGREYIIPGVDRLPNVELMDVGILTQINHPTGGFTKYKYEPHVFRDGNEEFAGGGLRVKQVIKRDGLDSDRDIIYNYSYNDLEGRTTGRVMQKPIYIKPESLRRYPTDGSLHAYRANTIRYSLSQAPLGTFQGAVIGYRSVVEYMSGNGKTVYEYAMPASWYESNDKPEEDCTTQKNGACDGLYEAVQVHQVFPNSGLRAEDFHLEMNPLGFNIFPFSENPNYDWNRGQLLSKKRYQQSGELVAREDYEYEIWYPNDRTAPHKVYGLKAGRFSAEYVNPSGTEFDEFCNYPGGCWRLAKYHYLTDVAKVLTSKTVTEYELGSANSIAYTTTYEHSGINHKYTTKVVETTSESETIVTTHKYPSDELLADGSPGTISALQSKNISHIPYEISNFVSKGGIEYLLSSQLNLYQSQNGLPVPYQVYEIETRDPIEDFLPARVNPSSGGLFTGFFSRDLQYYDESVKFSRYDNKGNVLQLENKVDGMITSYVWGYDQRYPVAKVINAEYTSIESILTQEDFDYLNVGRAISPILTDILDWEVQEILNKVRSGLPNAQVFTYTYKPLVGITSETDQSGKTTFYQYDNFNRLEAIKDQDGNVLEHYEYRYHGQ